MTARLTDAEIAEMESAAKALDGFPGTHQILRFIAECRKRGEELAVMTERAEKAERELAEADAQIFKDHNSRGQWERATTQGKAIERHKARQEQKDA